MFVDRAGKALSSFAILAVMALFGISVQACLAVALLSLGVWVLCADALGRSYVRRAASASVESDSAPAPRARRLFGH